MGRELGEEGEVPASPHPDSWATLLWAPKPPSCSQGQRGARLSLGLSPQGPPSSSQAPLAEAGKDSERVVGWE